MSEPMIPLNIAVLTVSDTRTDDTDRSGQTLVERARDAGHQVLEKRIVIDDVYRIRAIVAGWIADPQVQVILTTGGTDAKDVVLDNEWQLEQVVSSSG
jgi:molybdenum cofactor biosynthesis protein B